MIRLWCLVYKPGHSIMEHHLSSQDLNMKFLALVVVIIGSVASWKSGPYLPSGWKPDGPAFLLPMEMEKSPPKAVPVQEIEPSGSDYLREYGPPKEVSQDLTKQDLPEVVTEQAFVVIGAKFNPEEASEPVVQKAGEETEDETEDVATTASDEITTEVTTKEQITTEASIEAIILPAVEVKPAIDIRVEQSEAASQKASERISEVLEETEKVNDDIVKAVEKRVEELQVKAVEEVKNIAEAIASLEKEVKVQEVKSEIELRSTEDTGIPTGVPEDFLEYGPPGFREYGPPKEELKTSEKDSTQEKTTLNEIADSNETRRRRFSPKFRKTSKKAHH